MLSKYTLQTLKFKHEFRAASRPQKWGPEGRNSSQNGLRKPRGPKTGDVKSIELKRTHDILRALGHHGSRRKYTLVGFAAETENVIENAQQKRLVKNTDLIVANDVSGELGFESDENVITLVGPDGEKVLNQAPKYALAHEILDEVLRLRAGR